MKDNKGVAAMNVLIVLDSEPIASFRKEPEVQEALAALDEEMKVTWIQDTLMDADPYGYVERMEKEGPEWIEPQAEVMALLPQADILLVHWHCVNKKMIDAGKRLRFIGVMRSGLEHISLDYAREKGILVRNNPGRLANSVADLALAFMIDETRGITRRNLRLGRRDLIENDRFDDGSSRPMCMLKVGLVGFGTIAQAVARRVLACGSRVAAYDPYCPDAPFEKMGVERVSLDELLEQSDIISLHVRLSEATKNMIGKAQFEKMKPNAIFINTARAGLVEEHALIWALESGRIRGAGLDVFHEEPPAQDYPLLQMDNVTATPHIGGVFNGMLMLSLRMMIDSLKEYLSTGNHDESTKGSTVAADEKTIVSNGRGGSIE